ncbi:Protocadherin alpha-5, partial [Ophiophagus hannah]
MYEFNLKASAANNRALDQSVIGCRGLQESLAGYRKNGLARQVFGCVRPGCNCPKISRATPPSPNPYPSLIFTRAFWSGWDLKCQIAVSWHNSWTFKYGPGNSKQPGPSELPDKFIIPGSPAIISIRQDPPNSQTDKSDFITFGKKEETKKKKKKKKGNKAQDKKEKINSTADNSDQ